MRFKCEMIGFLLIFIFTFDLVSATLLYDHGSEVKNSTGSLLELGNLTILIYDSSSGGNLIYNESFTEKIVNGSWNVLIDSDFEYGKFYWKDYRINGDDLNFSGQDRIKFESSAGLINNASFINFSLIDSCSSGSSIRQINSDGSVVCESDDSEGYSSGWENDSTSTNTSLNANVGGNITTTNYGFFGWLGSFASRVTKLFIDEIDVSKNVSVGGNLTIGEELLFNQSDSKIYVKGGELYVEY